MLGGLRSEETPSPSLAFVFVAPVPRLQLLLQLQALHVVQQLVKLDIREGWLVALHFVLNFPLSLAEDLLSVSLWKKEG